MTGNHSQYEEAELELPLANSQTLKSTSEGQQEPLLTDGCRPAPGKDQKTFGFQSSQTWIWPLFAKAQSQFAGKTRASRRRCVFAAAAGIGMILLLMWLLSSSSASIEYATSAAEKAGLPGALGSGARGWGYTVRQGDRVELAKSPHYDDPFNPDDLTFSEEQCEAYFPGLWNDIERSVSFTKQYLDLTCDRAHARVVIFNNRMYLKMYRDADFTQVPAALALLYQSLITAREAVPNVEFCIGLEDWSFRGTFSLDRAPEDEDVWLMPDYGWFGWPEHVESYGEVRARMDKIERFTPWGQKEAKLFWRGSIKVGTADRESMLQAAAGHAWSDIKVIDWENPINAVPIEDHCTRKFQALPDGNTYSGRLRNLQNCKTVIITHQPRWIQHWTHLYNADWNSSDQNIVYVPHARGINKSTWKHLPDVMDALLHDDKKARLIAENQWSHFRNRYISPASAACYWREALKGFGSVQKYDVYLSGSESSYESFMLKGMR